MISPAAMKEIIEARDAYLAVLRKHDMTHGPAEAERTELQRFREREPLVQALLAKCDGVCNDDVDARQAVVAVLYARDDLRSFKVTE